VLSDTFVTVGSHTMRLSTLAILLGGVLLFGMAAFLVGLIRGRRVVLQRSATTDELNAHLARIAEALERVANRPADRAIAEASRGVEPAAEVKAGAQEPRSFQSMFGR
jgi:hypothetical protein